MTEAPTLKQIASPLWRIRNIYSIRNRKGFKEPFRPTKEQDEVLDAIYKHGKRKLIIPKARQLGMSTVVAIIILDGVLFGSGVQASIADFVSGNAKKKLEEKIKYAFEALDPSWRVGWEIVTDNRQIGEWRIKRVGASKEDESVVFAGDSIRGGTNQIIHLSELGETQVKAPARADETIEGALPSAESSIVIIETTWHGGKIGKLYRFVKVAMETPDEMKDIEKDYFVLFFPWHNEPTYINRGNVSQINDSTRQYFQKLSDRVGKKFSEQQMLWYQKQKEQLGERIYSVYPSLLEEIFLSPVEGAIYAKEIDEARSNNRVTKVPWDPKYKVFTAWDIGAPKNTIVTYFQIIDGERRYIDCDLVLNETNQSIEGLDLDYPDRVKHINAKPYDYDTHFLPHDAGNKNDLMYRSTSQAELKRLGLRGKVIVLQQAREKWIGINAVKAGFKEYKFDAEKMSLFLDALAMYRLRSDPLDETKFLDEPVHDWSSHVADSLRYSEEASMAGHISRTGNETMTNAFFDTGIIRQMAIKQDTSRRGVIERRGDSAQFVARPGENNWCRIWESPRIGREYLVVFHGSCIQAWRSECRPSIDSDDLQPALLVASAEFDGRYDEDILIDWTCRMAKLYGDCVVIPTINGRDRVIKKLIEDDVMIYFREDLDSQRPVGRQKPSRKPGYDLSEQRRHDSLVELAAMIRDNRIEFQDTKLLMQCDTFIEYDDGTVGPQQGYKQDAVESAAIAASSFWVATAYGNLASKLDLAD